MRTPYYHLFHRDGSPYMFRYWLVPQAPLYLPKSLEPVAWEYEP